MKDYASPRYSYNGRRPWKSILLAFVAGMIATTLVMQARLWEGQSNEPPILTKPPIPDHMMSTQQAFAVRRLLRKLNLLKQYSNRLIRRGYDLESLSEAAIRDPEPGIKAAHWKAIVTEARALLQSTKDDHKKDDEGSSKVSDQESVFSILLEGSDDDIVEEVHQNQQQEQQQQQQGEQQQQLQQTSTSDPMEPISMGVTPKVTPVPEPPRSTPAICATLQLSENIRTEYLKWKEESRIAINGTISSKFGVPICRGTRELITENAFSSAFMAEHRNAPARAMSGLHGFYKQRLSIPDIEELRSRGVIEQLYFDHDLKIAYCAVPKAGCTEVKAWMLNNAGLYLKSKTPHNRTLYTGERIQNGQVLSNERLQQIFSDGEYLKFTLVRNPFTKVLATYLERFNACEKQTRRTKAECDMWKRALLEIKRGNKGSDVTLPSDDISFTDYLKVMRDHPHVDVNFRNSHWINNVDICALKELTYDFLGRLEDKNDVKAVYDLLGSKMLNSLRHSENTAKKLKKYYTKEAKELVKQIFKSTDYEVLGYTPDNIVPEFPE